MDYQPILAKAREGVNGYLETNLRDGKIDQQSFDLAKQNTMALLEEWLSDPKIDEISPNLKAGIAEAVENEEWEPLVNAFRKKMSFGTGGIRGLMAHDKKSILRLKEHGLDATFLKGPNTLNNLVLLQVSAGVAQFGRDKGFDKIVIGYDSRVRGYDFAKAIAEEFLAYGFTVYLFDAPCPYPEVTFAIPYDKIKAHMGILVSASHNDYRYNGYKLSCGNGSQFDPEERAEMYDDYIVKSTTADVKAVKIEDAPKGKFYWLGGEELLPDFDYKGHSMLDVHSPHRDHIKTFLLKDVEEPRKLNMGYCAFHGAGRIAVPRLLKDIGFDDVKIITHNGLFELNGMFPSFCSDPGMEQQPDPGDARAAKVEVEAFKAEFPNDWDENDIIVGTDPDADRCGVVVKVPEDQRFLYGGRDYMLLPADDLWALLLWFRLKFDKDFKPEEAFVTLSHTTTDAIVRLALRYGVGVIKTWVGFAALSAAARKAWENDVPVIHEGKADPSDVLCDPFIQEVWEMHNGQRRYNLGSMEQSSGFSLLGFPPEDKFSLGVKGHVRDKDGTFAAVLVAEIADWAKKEGSSLFELIDKYVYLDPEVGLFVNYYEPDPLDGEYPGIEGDRMKKAFLRRALGMYQFAKAGNFEIAGVPVKDAVIYRTGKYDHLYIPTDDFKFPDEGVRFYFDEEKLNHLTIRPSGTTNSLRFHIQLHDYPTEDNLIDMKKDLRAKAREMADWLRETLEAPRTSEIE